MDELRKQIHRYFVAVYGPDYVYRAPEAYSNVLERWMIAVACDNLDHADRLMSQIETMAEGMRNG